MKEILPHWHSGFDWLRAMFIFLVLMMHAGLLHTWYAERSIPSGATILLMMHHVVCCAAVPGFLIISCFLQQKKEPQDWRKEREFFMGLGALYAIWVGLWVLVTKSAPSLSFLGLMEFALRGGGWAFYYFAVLIIVHLIRCSTKRMSNAWLWSLLGGSLLAIGLAYGLMSHSSAPWSERPTYWWPICFLPTPWIGMLLARYESSLRDQRTTKILVFALSALIFVSYLWEKSVVSDHPVTKPFEIMPEYLRPTPHLMACLLVIGALFIRQSPSWVRWVSRNSLGIFCLHVFILGGIGKVVTKIFPDPVLGLILTLICTMLITSCAAEIIRFSLKRRVI